MQVNLSDTEIKRGYAVTVNEKQVEIPHHFTVEDVPAIVGIINTLGEIAPNIAAVVSFDDGTWFVNGDQLNGSRNVSILEFSE